MYANILPSDPAEILSMGLQEDTLLQRVLGKGELGLKSVSGSKGDTDITKLERCYQEGDAKIRFPRNHDGLFEAVLINTAGGLTGGDRLDWKIDLGPRTSAALTTPACEKIYRSCHGAAIIKTMLKVDDNACLNWLPQETILFNQASLSRKLDVDLAPSARFLAVEAVVLGRKSMGESVCELNFRDQWRVRKDGSLIHADDFLFEGNILETAGANASLASNRAFAKLLYTGPESNEVLTMLVDKLRKSPGLGTSGVSTYGGKIIGRVLAPDSYTLRASLLPIFQNFMPGGNLPKVWNS
jgi:urease accessory protein